MKIAVMGAGGLGGLFGALLACAGEDVAFIARGPHLAAIRARGLAVESGLRDMHIDPARATDDPADIGPVDLVLFCVKLWDTEVAAAACRPLLGPETLVLTLQNGVEAPDIIAQALGRERVLAGVTYAPAEIVRPGVVRHPGVRADIAFGALAGGREDRLMRLAGSFAAAGIDAEFAGDVRRLIWEKFVFVTATSGVTSRTGKTFGQVRGDAGARAMFLAVMEETAVVARAKGVGVAADIVVRHLARLDAMPAGATASMARDLRRGNRLELDWLAGAVVRAGHDLGVATPVNGSIYAALAARR